VPDLAERSFELLVIEHRSRAADIAGFVETGYSFEGWTGWEWAAACRRQGVTFRPEPGYSLLVPNDNRRADFRFEADGQQLVVELADLRDRTEPKWLRGADAKLVGDRARLVAAAAASAVPLAQVAVVASAAPVTGRAKWADVLGALPDPLHQRSIELPPEGEAMVTLWMLEGNEASR